jgi:hypothetical protein
MRLHYFPKNGALWDGCCDPLLRHIANIYLRRWPYGGVTNEAIAVGLNTYGAVGHLGAGPDALWGVS